MSKKKKGSKKSSESSLRVELDLPIEENLLEEYLDLSLREILILFFIMRYPGEMLRNSLREEVNDYLKKDFSASSFYNILEKLQGRGLITIKDGKIDGKTDKAENIIRELNRLTLICQIPFRNMTDNIIERIKVKLSNLEVFASQITSSNQKLLKKTLVINLEILMDITVLNTILDTVTEQLFILSTPNEFKRYQARGLSSEIQQSQIIESNIREANEFFDSVIIIGFTSLSKYPEKMKNLLKNELKRVMQGGGMIFIVSDTDFQIHGHHFLGDVLNNIMSKSDFLAITEKSHLFNDIEEMGFKNPDAEELNGMIVGWGFLE